MYSLLDPVKVCTIDCMLFNVLPLFWIPVKNSNLPDKKEVLFKVLAVNSNDGSLFCCDLCVRGMPFHFQ